MLAVIIIVLVIVFPHLAGGDTEAQKRGEADQHPTIRRALLRGLLNLEMEVLDLCPALYLFL